MKKYRIISGLVLTVVLGAIFISILNFNAFANDMTGYKKAVLEAFEKENWKEVKRLSDAVIENYKDADIAYFFRGIALDELGYYEDAIENYTRAIKIRPTSNAYQNRGLAYLNNKQYSKAIKDYDKALELDRTNEELILVQREMAVNAQKGFVITKNGNLTNYQSINDPIYLANEYKQMPEAKKKEYIDAVKNYSDKILPIYYITVAEDIYPTDKNLAAFLFYIGMFRSMEDVQMCKDTSAQQVLILMPTIASDTVKYISKMKPKKRYKLLQDVLDWDEAHPNRPDPKWICYHGINVFTNDGKVSTYPKSKFEGIKRDSRASFIKVMEKLKK